MRKYTPYQPFCWSSLLTIAKSPPDAFFNYSTPSPHLHFIPNSFLSITDLYYVTVGVTATHEVEAGDDQFDQYRKRMMLAYRFRPNPLNNPRRDYY